ncbi:hypothetical protein BGZ63DRAFT_363747 [Mariannaea sp. PMI_226]|nr:hypothetical protein BGZ63DRAFT_363747 [Mariannaea sp. PMI_226]
MGHPQGSLPRRRSKYLRASPEGTIVAAPIPIPGAISQPALNPMQRWQDSPPETEAASLSAIAGALKSALPLPESSDDPRSRAGLSRAASTTSLNSERTSHSSKSATSARSATSKDLFLPRLNTRGGISKVKRVNPKANNKERKTFQCTFCCDSFRSKYDWARHEKSLHLSLEGWVCTPEGGAVVSSDTGGTHCAYCNLPDPSPEHLETHQHSVCQSTGPPHIFNRKDHLVQHLRLVHQLDMIPVVNHWKVEAPPVRSRCGICDTEMNTWKERVDHIAQHFRKGKTMADWKGDHCFEPAIAARVTNAIPPYLIRDETISLVPFSATDAGTRDHFSQIHINHLQNTTVDRDKPKSMPPPTSSPDENPSTTFVDVLALGLARFARQNMILGVVPTDEMFQNESRRLVYGCEDAWDQTIADNAEWLSSFRLKNMKGRMENENK